MTVQQCSIGTAAQHPRIRNQPTHPGAQGLRVARTSSEIAAEQHAADVALARASGQRIMNAQDLRPSMNAPVTRIQFGREAPVTIEIEKTAQRQDLALCRGDTVQAIMEQNRATGEAAADDVEPQMMPAIGQDRMLASAVGDDGQPWRQQDRIERVGLTGGVGFGNDLKRTGINRGMPNDPGVRGLDLRTLGESAPPTDGGRRSSDWRRAGRGSRCLPGRTKRHSPDRDAAIPTSIHNGRHRPGGNTCGHRATPLQWSQAGFEPRWKAR